MLTAPTGATGSFITVKEGATLTVCGGGNGVISGTGTSGLRGIEVEKGGSLILNSGTISNFTSTSIGAGVFHRGGGGTFTMKGGAITNNTYSGTANGGGGVCLFDNAVLVMNDGTISGNTAANADYNGDGVYAGTSAKIKVYGGAVQNNGSYGISAMGDILLSGEDVVIEDNIETFATSSSIGITIESGSYNGMITRGERSDGKTVVGTIEISGGTFTGMEKAALIEWLAKDAPYVVNGESTYTVDEGFADCGEIIDFGSALNVNLNLVGDNGVTLAETFNDFNVAVTSGKAAVETIKIYPADSSEATELQVVAIKGIAAKNIHDVFTVTVTKGGVEYYKKELSVYSVINELYTAHNDPDSDYANMLEDAVNYGIAAQAAFGHTVSTDDLGEGSDDPQWTADASHGWDGTAGAVAVSLNLKERIELNVYVNKAGAAVTNAKRDGTEPITVTDTTPDSAAYTRLTINTIDVVDATDTLVIEIEDCGTLTYSIKDYVASNTDAKYANLMTALAKYMNSVANVIGNKQ